jgi:hypothetical protein
MYLATLDCANSQFAVDAWRAPKRICLPQRQHSGMGKYCGKAGFDALSNSKSMLIGNPDKLLDVFPPYGGKDSAKNLRVFS